MFLIKWNLLKQGNRKNQSTTMNCYNSMERGGRSGKNITSHFVTFGDFITISVWFFKVFFTLLN